MKNLTIIILLGFLLAGCDRGNMILNRMVVGTWIEPGATRGGITILSDGRFSSEWSATTYEGTWRIKGRMLVMTITNASGTNHPPVGSIQYGGIEEVSTYHLTIELDGRTTNLERK